MSSTDSSQVLLCKYYLQGGGCARGTSCLYSHQQDHTTAFSATPSSVVCVYFEKGYCRFGNKCQQLHPVQGCYTLTHGSANTGDMAGVNRKLHESELRAPHPQNPIPFGPCRFFQRGNCTKGGACPFPHIISNAEAHTIPFTGPLKGKGTRYLPGATFTTNDVNIHDRPVAPKSPCKFFGRGECTKGAGCQFSHVPAELLHPLSQSGLSSSLSNAPYPASAIDLSTAKHQQDEISNQHSQPDTASSEAAVTERFIFSCNVQFGPGASVREITTSFDSCHIILSNLPQKITQDQLIGLTEPFGALSSIVLENSSALVPPSAHIKYAECAQAALAVDNLDNREFNSMKLAARLNLRAVESGVGILLSRKVKISWYAPSIVAWAHYKTISTAKDHAQKLNGKTFDGRIISVSFQTPGLRQTRSFSIEIKGLPVNVRSIDLQRFCGSSSLKLRSSYNREEGITKICEQLGMLHSFDVLPTDKTKAKITAFAQFSSAEAAAAAVKNLNGVPQLFLNRSPLWLEQIHSLKYNIPARQFSTLVVAVDRLRDVAQNGCKIRYYGQNENGTPADPVCVRIYGPDPKAFGHMKIKLEYLLQGDLLVSDGKEIWDEYFDTLEGDEFLQTINSDPTVFVKLDTRSRNLRIFGPESNRGRAKDQIIHSLAMVHSKRHILTLERDVLRALLTGGLKDLHGVIGAEKILLDVVAKTLTVRGNAEEGNTVRRLVAAMQKSAVLHNADAVCPVCFCEATDSLALPCGHIYCKLCLQHLLRSAVGLNFTLLRCVAEAPTAESQKSSCAKDIPYRIIRLLLSSAEEIRLLEASFLSYIYSHPMEFRYCPTPDCKVVYRPTKEGIALQCSACLNRICGACHVEFHEGLTCAEHRDSLGGGHDAFRRWREENGVKSCPKCHAALQKAGGCNHMTCICCKTHICWVCMATFGEEDSSGGVYHHMREKHGGIQ